MRLERRDDIRARDVNLGVISNSESISSHGLDEITRRRGPQSELEPPFSQMLTKTQTNLRNSSDYCSAAT